MQSLSLCVPGNLGNIAGRESDGVLIGALTATVPDSALLAANKAFPFCYADDGGTYVSYATEIAEATGDDVEALPAVPAVDDAIYFGHASNTFDTLGVNITTQGAGTWTVVWEYWDGDSWESLSNVTDGTTGFTATTGWTDVTFDEPGDWAKNTVDNVLAYWIRARVSAYTSVTTQPLLGQGRVTFVSALFTDDTTDFGDAGAGDVDLLPAVNLPTVGDAFYVGHSEKFCKVELNLSQAGVGTYTILPEYWDGDSWESLATVDDDSAGFTTGTSTYLVHFVPPSDWTANTALNGPDGNTGFFVRFRLSAYTSMSAQPQLTQGWVYPLVTGASGVPSPVLGGGTVTATLDAQTKSGTTADSTFLLINTTTGAVLALTWTKATGHDSDSGSLAIALGNELALVQITEDGSTEYANANIVLNF